MKSSARYTLTALALLAGAWPLLAQTAPAPSQADNPPAKSAAKVAEANSKLDEVVMLSPFEVSATRDTGYQATETLAGTRIRTDLKDVGGALSVYTKEFMKDIGATDAGSLLQYTTNAEVAGTLGTYTGLGNGTSVSEVGSLRSPSSAQRVRGLASADVARDYFVSDIPFDTFNVDRVDIMRGPNSILFGLGSPAGMVNTSLHNAEFRTMGSLENRVGSYGTVRNSIDFNQELIKNVLAIRLDGLWNDQKYEQKQAFQNDKRFYGSVRFDPQLFSRRDFHTSIKIKFENGDIKADRPRTVTPNDSITPWFRAVDTTSLNGGAGKQAITDGYTIGAAATTNYGPWAGGIVGQQQPAWFMDGTSGALQRIYGGYINTGALKADGSVAGSGVNLLGQRYGDTFTALTSLSSYAINANLPNSQYGQYRTASLQDPTVFDFYHNLIDGPTASQFEKWNALNIDLTQTFWDDRVGVQLGFDHQKYQRGGQNLISNPTLNIDILKNFQDYVIGPNNTSNGNVANPNYGRPFITGGPGNGNSYASDRKDVRASLFGEVRATDFFDKNSLIAKLLGKHRFNGVFSDEKYATENRNWQMYANSAAYAAYKLQGNPDGFTNLAPTAVIYLGSSLANANSAANAHISGITSNLTLPDGGVYQFDSTWRPQPGVVYNAPWTVPANLQPLFGVNGGANFVAGGADYSGYTQASNPANYVGWNSSFTDTLLRYNNGADLSLLTAAAKTMRETKSLAGSWQGFLWNDAIVPTLGWRYDEVDGKGVTAQTLPGAVNRGALNLDPNVYKLPDVYPASQIFKEHSTSGGLVMHLNKILEKDPLPFNVSLSYNKSSNFQVTDTRRNIYGTPIANPSGSTKDYGVLLSTKDGKYSFRVVKYETSLVGANTQLDNSGIYNTIRDSMNWRNIKTYYMSAYAWSTAGQTDTRHFAGIRYMWDPAWVDANGRPVASGQAASGPAGSHLETQVEADAHRDASIKALNDMQVFLANNGYFAAWNYGAGPTTQAKLQTPGQYLANPTPPDAASVYDYRTAPLMQGFAVTADTQSKGYEFELTANPLPNWRVSFNAAETTAIRTNVGGPVLDTLVAYMDGVMAGPGGDLTRFNSDWSAGNQLRLDWTGWRAQYTLLKLQAGSAASELRKWRYNVVTNYSFTHGKLKGVGVGASYRWQEKVIIGYPVIPGANGLASFDLTKPYYGPAEEGLDLWASYEHKLTKKIGWKIQANVRNVGKKDDLIPISVQPDGKTWASVRVAPIQEWFVSNTFTF
jgi:outer membrane receptor protein involved in Fe transport